jgi:hypothetical protein
MGMMEAADAERQWLLVTPGKWPLRLSYCCGGMPEIIQMKKRQT